MRGLTGYLLGIEFEVSNMQLASVYTYADPL